MLESLRRHETKILPRLRRAVGQVQVHYFLQSYKVHGVQSNETRKVFKRLIRVFISLSGNEDLDASKENLVILSEVKQGNNAIINAAVT